MVAILVGVCSGATHTVGGTTGWTIPPSSSSTFYSDWASKQQLQAGDVLVFNFTAGHTVAPVSKASYDSCNTKNLLSAATTASPFRFNLTAGTHYYICTIPTHCTFGQKLAVTVTGPSPSPIPAPQPTTATPPPPPATTSSPPPTPSTPATPLSPTTGAPPPAGGPAAPSTPEGGASPPAGSFAAPTAAGVSLLSLVSIAVAALLF